MVAYQMDVDDAPRSPINMLQFRVFPGIHKDTYVFMARYLSLGPKEERKELKKLILDRLRYNNTHSIVEMALGCTNAETILHLDLMISNEFHDVDKFLATHLAITFNLKETKEKLREFFEKEFSFAAYPSQDGRYVDRTFWFDNRNKIDNMPTGSRLFIFNCMMSASTQVDYVDARIGGENPPPLEVFSPLLLKMIDNALNPKNDNHEMDIDEILTTFQNIPERRLLEIVLNSNLKSYGDFEDLNQELTSFNHDGILLLYIMGKLGSVFPRNFHANIIDKLQRHFYYEFSRGCGDLNGNQVNRTFYLDHRQQFEAMPHVCMEFVIQCVTEVATSRRQRDAKLNRSTHIMGMNMAVDNLSFI